jgi:hypothetical protein
MKHETRQLAQYAKERQPSGCRPHCWGPSSDPAWREQCLYCRKVRGRVKPAKPHE